MSYLIDVLQGLNRTEALGYALEFEQAHSGFSLMRRPERHDTPSARATAT